MDSLFFFSFNFFLGREEGKKEGKKGACSLDSLFGNVRGGKKLLSSSCMQKQFLDLGESFENFLSSSNFLFFFFFLGF